jgi:PAS domain S-box-containing protein
MSESPEPQVSFSKGVNNTGELIKAIDWSATPLGSPDGWPQSLQSALSICINSNFPIAIYWGPELVLLYNDAWSPIPGSKHPWAIGKRAIEVWPEIWNDIEPQFKKAFGGLPGGSRDALLPMQRHGYTEECYFDFTFTPIHGASGKVEGIFNAVIETTYRVINERRSFLLQKLSDSINAVSDEDAVFEKVNSVLSTAKEDVPFYFIYLLDEFNNAKLKASSEDGIELKALWPVQAVMDGSVLRIADISQYFNRIPQGFWPEPTHEAIMIPIRANDGHTFGCIVGGLSSRRAFDKEYKSFYDSVATIIGGELNTIQSLKSERQRAESLAQIDRAKTAFFSNISHEFRTPLTLMLSPLESALADENLADTLKDDLSIAYRNTLRLQKLVNSLLDFSRIEAGRMEAQFEEVDLATLTADLASSFRSAIENAGIKYNVETSVVLQGVAVDVEMWEKIVLNLLSNAFKYTEQGSIEVKLKDSADHVVFTVKDTGIGISESDRDKIFERFYRVNNTSGRSQEGTGIGLAMVRELVHLHQGQINVESEPGKGSTFSVTIPKRIAARKARTEESISNSKLRTSFIAEVAKWNGHTQQQISSLSNRSSLPKVLIADDNSDMRDYIARLLTDHFQIVAVSNGEEAFAQAVEFHPDLIVSDIMMPKLDGFGLLKKLRSTFVTRNTPIIFLSARAGEEAKVEGINAGADDYLVKPFSAKELFARVNNQIIISRTRLQSEKEFFNLFLQSPAHIHVMRGPDHTMEFFHPLGRKFIGRDITGMKIREALPEVQGQGYFEMLDQVYFEGKDFFLPETKATFPNENGEPEDYYFNITYLPWKGVDGKIQGVLQFTFDVTEQAKARKKIEEAEYRLQTAVDLAELGTWHIDLKTNFITYSERTAAWWGLSADGDTIDAIIQCIHEDDRERVAKAVADAIANSGFYQADYRLLNAKTGQQRYILASGKVFRDDHNNPVRLSGIAKDITLERMAHAELERLVSERTRELKVLNAELQRSNEDLRQFTYVASHDLQEPLRKIQTFCELAEARLANPEAAKIYLEKIENSAARMSTLIRDVLLYSQVQYSQIEKEEVDLNEVIDGVRNDFELLIQQRNATLESDRLPVIKGNKLQFQQLFQNLINNAIKFSENDPHIAIRYHSDEADMTAGELGAKRAHIITVADNGIGFDQQHANQIFELFSRLHNRQDYAGTGIGLTLCKKIVENHNGTIKAYSEKGKGSRFEIILPVGESLH